MRRNINMQKTKLKELKSLKKVYGSCKDGSFEMALHTKNLWHDYQFLCNMKDEEFTLGQALVTQGYSEEDIHNMVEEGLLYWILGANKYGLTDSAKEIVC
jgi:hypothetical protein